MADDRLTLAQLGARVGRGDNPNATGPRNLLRTLGSYLAPELTSYLTEPETPYSERLRAAGGAIGPQGQLLATGKVPSVVDPRLQGAQAEAFDLASMLVPGGGAAKLGGSVAAAAAAGMRRLTPGMLKELTGPKAAETFHAAVKAIKEASPHGAAVTLKDIGDYAQEGARLFATKDKLATVAVMPDGDIVSVAKHPNAPFSGAGPASAAKGVQAGGTKLDAYDTVLPALYGKSGFKEVARLPFNPKFAPEDWNPADFAQFSGKTPNIPPRMKDYKIGGPGEPDIVGMVANPPGRTSGVQTQTWEDMQLLQELAKAGRHPAQFINDPTRSIFPSIYGDPREIAALAASRVGPEDPMLKRLFKVSRDDLFQMALEREKTGLGNLPPPTMAPTKGSETAIAKVMTPQNIQRYVDVLTEARKYPGLMQGGYGWYIQDPLFQQMERVVGPQRALVEYPQFAGFQGSHSPGSNVLTEIHRGTTAYQAAKEGWLPEYIQYGSKKKGVPIPPDIEARLQGVPGHLAHGAQTSGLWDILAGVPMDTPKTTPYVNAAGVPQTGYSWQIPTLDAMMARSLGMSDVRTAKTLNEIQGSITPPELASILPHYQRMVDQAGMNPVGAQGVGWTAFAPQTGVKTALGAPKLELQAQQIGRRAQETGKSPEQVRDEGLQGLEHWLVPLVGGPTAAALLGRSSEPTTY